jgi:hypothetical protein
MEGLADRLAEKLSERSGSEVESEENPDGYIEGYGEEIEGESEQNLDDEAESEGEGEQEGGDAPVIDPEAPLEKFVELAPLLGVDPEVLYSLKMGLSDTGEEITIGEAKDRLQQYQRTQAEVEQERQRLSYERNQLANHYQQLSQTESQLDAQGREAYAELMTAEAEFQRIDWKALENIDPGRAALEKQNLLQRHAQAKRALDEANQRSAQYAQQQYTQAKQYHDQMLLQKVKEWQDPKVANEQINELLGWAKSSYQFEDQELAGAVDWRHRDILRKAWLYDKMQQQKGQVQAKAPVTLKRGSAVAAKDTAQARLAETIKRAQKSRRPEDKIAAGRAILESAFASRRKR